MVCLNLKKTYVAISYALYKNYIRKITILQKRLQAAQELLKLAATREEPYNYCNKHVMKNLWKQL